MFQSGRTNTNQPSIARNVTPEDISKLLKNNDLSHYEEKLSSTSHSEQTRQHAYQILFMVNEINKVVSKPVLLGLLRLLASPDTEKNAERLYSIIKAILGRSNLKKENMVRKIFEDLQYIEQIHGAFEAGEMFFTLFDDIMEKPANAKIIAEAFKHMVSQGLDTSDRGMIRKYSKYLTQHPTHAMTIAAAVSEYNRPIYQGRGDFTVNGYDSLFEKEILQHPEHSLRLLKGFKAVIQTYVSNQEEPRWPSIMLRNLLIPQKQYSDIIGRDLCAIKIKKQGNNIDPIELSFMDMVQGKAITLKSIEKSEFTRLNNMDNEHCWYLKGLVYAGKIEVKDLNIADNKSTCAEKAEQFFKYMDDERSPWYCPAQAALFDLLLNAVDPSIKDPQEGTPEHARRQELAQIQAYLLENNYRDFTGADIDQASSSTRGFYLGQPFLVKYDVSATLQMREKRSIGTQYEPPM